MRNLLIDTLQALIESCFDLHLQVHRCLLIGFYCTTEKCHFKSCIFPCCTFLVMLRCLNKTPFQCKQTHFFIFFFTLIWSIFYMLFRKHHAPARKEFWPCLMSVYLGVANTWLFNSLYCYILWFIIWILAGTWLTLWTQMRKSELRYLFHIDCCWLLHH